MLFCGFEKRLIEEIGSLEIGKDFVLPYKDALVLKDVLKYYVSIMCDIREGNLPV
jgi:hypothetical protein